VKSSQSKDGPDGKEAHRSFNNSDTVKETSRRSSGQRILTKGRITGTDFSQRGKFNVSSAFLPWLRLWLLEST